MPLDQAGLQRVYAATCQHDQDSGPEPWILNPHMHTGVEPAESAMQTQGTHDLWPLKQDAGLNYGPEAWKGELLLPEGVRVRGKMCGVRGKE